MITLTLPGGHAMPALGLGTWQLRGDACVACVETALDAGYRHIDTAQAYGNEAEIGRALAASGLPRGELFVTTKLWTDRLAAAEVRRAAEESLAKLRLDRLDLLLIHWPNPAVPLGETLEAMRGLVAAGLVRAIGASNFPVALLREAVETHGAPIACDQVEHHVYLAQRAVRDYAGTHGIAVTAYSPTALGGVADDPVLRRIGERHGKSPFQVALRFLVEEGVAAIPRSGRPENIRANIAIFDFALDAAERAEIGALARGQRLISPPWAPAWDPD